MAVVVSDAFVKKFNEVFEKLCASDEFAQDLKKASERDHGSMQAHEVNAMVKRLNDTTELPGDPDRLAALRARTEKPNLTQAEILANQQDLDAYRAGCCDVAKRRELVADLNADPTLMYQWRFRLVNNRIMADKR